MKTLKSILIDHKGYCQVMVIVSIEGKETTLVLPMRVSPSEQMCDAILTLNHIANIEVTYPNAN